jgi:hypothetical protein
VESISQSVNLLKSIGKFYSPLEIAVKKKRQKLVEMSCLGGADKVILILS